MIKSGTVVAGLTAGALAVVCVMAVQASGSTSNQSKHPSQSSSKHPAHSAPKPPAVPTPSGSGKRVVYALGANRVWLVGSDGKVERTFKVAPSSRIDPIPTSYKVYSRSAKSVGSDGVHIEHVVLFASLGPIVVGFDAALDGSTPPPDIKKRSGGIRESRADGAAMWKFATVGTRVVVVI